MTEKEFDQEMTRLTSEYGASHFKAEKLKLIWGYVNELNFIEFRHMISHFLSSMRQAPLPKDFQEAARMAKKQNFDRTVNQAVNFQEYSNRTLKEQLMRAGYPGCNSIKEATEVQMEKNRIARALNEPNDAA